MKEFVGNIWTETDKRGVVQLGFARKYIDEVLGECFHVIPADTRQARKGQPLMVLETNDGTERIKSPLSGTILVFADKAKNFPDRLTEEDVICEVLPEGVKLDRVVQKNKIVYDDPFADADVDQRRFWANLQNQAAPPPPPQPIDNRTAVERLAEAQRRNAIRDGQRAQERARRRAR
jgi:hypothetical protein